MAERIKRYRPLGVTIPTVPTVDYTAAGRAQARVYQNVARGLDALTDFAFKRAEEKALIEGAEYGAENAPTMQQLRDAGGDIEDVVPGDQTTVFGRAARKAALTSMNVNFEVAARNDLLNLQMQAQLEDMDTATFTDKSNAIIDGYTSTLQDISPSTALKFRASMATVGNSALLAYSKEQIKKQQEAEQFAVMNAMDIIVNGDMTRGIQSRVQQIMSEGSTTTYDKDGNMQHVSIMEKIDAERRKLKEMAFSVTDKAGAEKYLKRFDDSIALAMETEVSNFVLASPTKNLRELKSGVIQDQKMQDLWNNMSAPQRANARSKAYKALTEEHTRESQEEARREANLERRAKEAYVNIVDAIQIGDTAARDDALAELRITDPSKYEEFNKKIRSGDVPDDAQTVILLQRQLANKELTKTLVTTEFVNGNLSLTTFKTFMNSASSLSDNRYTAAVSRAKSILGLPELPLRNPSRVERKAQQKVAAIMVELQTKQFDPSTPEDFDPLSFVDKRAKEIKIEMDNDNSEAVAKAEKRLPALAKALGLPAGASYDEISKAYLKTTNTRIKQTYAKTMDTLTEANK